MLCCGPVPQAGQRLYPAEHPDAVKIPNRVAKTPPSVAPTRVAISRPEVTTGDLLQGETPLDPERAHHRFHRRDIEFEEQGEQDDGPDSRSRKKLASGAPTGSEHGRVARSPGGGTRPTGTLRQHRGSNGAARRPTRSNLPAKPAGRSRSGSRHGRGRFAPISPRRARASSRLDGIGVDRDVLGGGRHDHPEEGSRAPLPTSFGNEPGEDLRISTPNTEAAIHPRRLPNRSTRGAQSHFRIQGRGACPAGRYRPGSHPDRQPDRNGLVHEKKGKSRSDREGSDPGQAT